MNRETRAGADAEGESNALSRRRMLGRAAAAGGVVWATPLITAAPAAASHSPMEIPGPECLGVVKTLWIKYEVENDIFTNVGGADCLATDKDDDEDRASNSEVCCFLVNNRFVADVEIEEGEATKVVITIPEHCTTEQLVAAAKQGKRPGCDTDGPADGADEKTEHTITFRQVEGEKNAISHVEFGIGCCLTECQDAGNHHVDDTGGCEVPNPTVGP